MRKRTRMKAEIGVVVALGMIAGILIWSKLRLATDVPRSAYAEPEQRADADPRGRAEP